MSDLYYPIVIPVVAGILCLLIPNKLKALIKALALLVAIATFALTIWLFQVDISEEFLRNDTLSGFILLAIGLFGLLTVLYSVSFMAKKGRLNEYYGYVLMTLGAACGAALADNLILLLVFWGFLGLTLYMLIGIGGPKSAPAAKKTLVIVGGTDALMVLGVAIIWHLTNSLSMTEIAKMSALESSPLALVTGLPIIAFLCLACGSFAKAGAMPLHTWIPDMAATAPVPVTAYLPASLDKLLGIYLLARIGIDLFVISGSWSLLLMIIGAVTIIGGVMMALVQHDLKRLLSYHAVSQVGYMVLGIGTGNPIGIAGGLFHMLNNTIYKSCLFFCGGSVEHRTGTSDLDKLGGLARFMPITFITCLIAALSISGIPPFNGFVSKWMVYQGVIELGKSGGKLWILWLVAAMFGSALTLASFMKVIHAVFLGAGQGSKDSGIKEVKAPMWITTSVLAILCIVFGVFAVAVPLTYFIPASKEVLASARIWQSGLATLMIIGGIVLGLIIYLISNMKGIREDSSYIGGEVLSEETRVTGADFYGSVKDMPLIRWAYKKAEQKVFDIYEQGKKLILSINDKLSDCHTGILRTYLVWCLVGMLVLLIILMRQV